jgi:hypothetical protein
MSDSESLSSSCAYDAKVAVKVFVIDPISKSVASSIGFPVALDATP